MQKPDYFRGCCAFDTFVTAFAGAARRRNVPLILVNQLQARRHWRLGLTGGEALEVQRGELIRHSGG